MSRVHPRDSWHPPIAHSHTDAFEASHASCSHYSTLILFHFLHSAPLRLNALSRTYTLSLSFTNVALSIVFAWRTFFVVGVQTLIQHLPPPPFLDYFTTSPRSPSNLLDHACWILLFVAIMKKKHICICIGVYRNLTEEKRTFFLDFRQHKSINKQPTTVASRFKRIPRAR